MSETTGQELVKVRLREAIGALKQMKEQAIAAYDAAEDDDDAQEQAESDETSIDEAITAVDDAINALDNLDLQYEVGAADFVAED